MRTLNDHFARVYVINLPYKPDRRQRLEQHLVGGGFAEHLTWVTGCSGDWMPPPAWWNAGNGAWGCLLSHARVIQDAIMDGLEDFLVLEDDAVFQPAALGMLERLMNEVPEDWEQLYLGGQHMHEPEDVADRPFVLRAWNVNRTHAYALRRPAFVRFHQHLWHAPDYIDHKDGWHLDHQLGVAHQRGDWKVYAPCWWLAGQESDWSNISGRKLPRLWWHPNRHAHRLPFIWVPADWGDDLRGAQPFLHGGNNLKPRTFEDIGLDEAANGPDRLAAWLVMIAREALDMGLLPALQHSKISIEDVRDRWPAGVHHVATADLAGLVNYPFNGLFPHPLNNGQPHGVSIVA
ncbi:MAG: glycosyltransferase family 25 protein [Verrucomicrobiales bacterium]